MHGIFAGVMEELEDGTFLFTYKENYKGSAVSLTMPLSQKTYKFNQFPPFFEGLLPEGPMLQALINKHNLKSNDLFGQLLKVGDNLIGAASVEEIT